MSVSPVVQISTAGSYTITGSYSDYILSCSNGNIILTLPTITSSGTTITTTRNDTGNTGNTLTVTPATGQSINRQINTGIAQLNQSQLRFISYVNPTDVGWFYGLVPVGATGSTGNTGSLALTSIGNTGNINGATLNNGVFNLQPAGATFGGVITTGSQAFAGPKQFVDTTQATSDTAAAVTVAGGAGITKQLILGAVGDPGSVSGLLMNSALLGYSPSILNINMDYSNIFNATTAFTGSTTIYISRIGRMVTMTINSFSGTANGSNTQLFAGIPNIFMPTADTDFSVWVTATPPSSPSTEAYYTLELVQAGGVIRLYGTNFRSNNFPASTFTFHQGVINYNVV